MTFDNRFENTKKTDANKETIKAKPSLWINGNQEGEQGKSVNFNQHEKQEEYEEITKLEKLEFYEDLEKLFKTLPPKIIAELRKKELDGELDDITEIIMDIGRRVEIRHLNKRIENLGHELITEDEIQYVISKIDDFTLDNRSGIPGTLHRISAIRNRKGKIIGLTCRVGRVVTGTINCIRDLVLQGKSILFLGRPGVGKTTKLREIARLLADDLGKRVIVVDTSNEIAGDGDIAHKAIGNSRRMQVSSPERQKDVMIEAVENHTPEVIVVDEIGTEQEAHAARTIAERGVMLIATAHGNTLENLIKNPTLSDLAGGVQSVTLGDDEARRRSTQKTILEREKQPTFDIVIEIRDRDTLAVYPNASEAVDNMLREWPVTPEIRRITDTCRLSAEKYTTLREVAEVKLEKAEKADQDTFEAYLDKYSKQPAKQKFNRFEGKKIFIYAVSRSMVDKALERLDLDVEITRNIDEADVVIAHKSYSNSGAKILNAAKDYHLPIYFIKTNTMPQIQKAIKDSFGLKDKPGDQYGINCFDETEEALKEVQAVVYKILNGHDSIELEPRKPHIRKLQHEIIEQHQLSSVSIGEEPERHLKVLSLKHLREAG